MAQVWLESGLGKIRVPKPRKSSAVAGQFAVYRASFKINPFRGFRPRNNCGNPVLYENVLKPCETNNTREDFVVRLYICSVLPHHVRCRLQVIRVFPVTDMPCAAVVAVCAASAR